MRIILLIAFLGNTLNVYGQLDLKKKVAIDVDNSKLEDVLVWLQAHHEVKLSYGFDNVSPDIRITLHSESISVFEIIQAICQQGSLIFQIIDSTVVFKYQKSFGKPIERDANPQKPLRESGRDVQEDNIIVDSLTKANSISQQQRPGDNDSALNTPDTSVLKHVAIESEQIKPVEIASVSHSSARFRRKLDIQTGLFISYAIDFNRFEFADRDISVQKYKTERNESYSLGAYFLLSKKLYISLGATYVTKDFHLNYNYKVIDLSDPFPIPDKTYVGLQYLEIPLTFGYALISWKKYSALVSTGIYPSFLLKEKENTTYQNQGNPNTKYFLEANQATLFSASFGFIIHRYINRACGIFIEPGYLHFFGPVNDQAMDAPSSLFRLKAGIQLTLSGKR